MIAVKTSRVWMLCLAVAIVVCVVSAAPEARAQVVTKQNSFAVMTRIIEVTPQGVLRPLADADVWVVAGATRPTPHGPQSQVVGRWRARTRADGIVVFPEVPDLNQARYQVNVVFQGVTYRSDEFSVSQTPPQQLRVFHTVPGPIEQLSLRSHWSLDVGEAYLRVSQVVRVMNDSLTTVDYTHAPIGLRMPTLTHALSDRTLITHGIFPPGKVHGSGPPSTGQGRLIGEDGAVVFRGPVPPGSGLFFQFSYNVPFNAEDVLLGAVSDLDLADAAVTIRWTDRTTPRARVLNPNRTVRGAREGAIRTDMLIHGRLRAGDPVWLQLERLPVQTRVPKWAAAVGGTSGLAVFLVVLLGAIRRRKVGAAS